MYLGKSKRRIIGVEGSIQISGSIENVDSVES